MRTACFIPIKEYSERVPGKNLRILNGKPLYQYIIENVICSDVFDDIYVDTNSTQIAEFAKQSKISIIERAPELATNAANGNDLLYHHFCVHPEYDYYFQAFATAPFLKAQSIRDCYFKLTTSNQYDSCFTATARQGFFWFNDLPINYRPSILPRSQDLKPIIEETTGLYGIRKDALERYRCRIGQKPYAFIVDKYEAVDINTEQDFIIASYVGNGFMQ